MNSLTREFIEIFTHITVRKLQPDSLASRDYHIVSTEQWLSYHRALRAQVPPPPSRKKILRALNGLPTVDKRKTLNIFL